MTREKAIEIISQVRALMTMTGDKSPKALMAQESLDMAIKALEQEPCENCVSRQAVIDAIHEAYMNAYDEHSLIRVLKQRVNELPPVTPQPKTGHWIPVSERLPIESGMYLITRVMYLDVTNFSYLIDIDYWNNAWTKDIVIAWMSLPQPYKAESEE